MAISEFERQALVGGRAADARTLLPKPGPRVLLDRVQLVVAAIGIVVVQDEMRCLGSQRQLASVRDQAVSPSMLAGHIFLEVLRVVDQQVRSSAEANELVAYLLRALGVIS